jgi:DNA-binding transcriptional regulator YdaS (Cro superfamily)
MQRELKVRLFARACDIVGGRERLATRLDVEPHALEFWLAGRATPPDRVFMAVVDLVLEDDIARARQDRRQDAVQRALVGTLRERSAAPPAAKLP